MTKLNKFFLLSTSLMLLVGCSASETAVQEVDAEAAPVVSEEMMTPVETGEKSTKADWGQCRDVCYNARSDCFNAGKETEVCERIYDNCVGTCDAKH